MKLRNYWIKLLSCFFKTEKNIKKNKYDILNLLFNSEHLPISTKESIDLFSDVKKEFEQQLNKKSLEASIIVADIDEYFNKLK